MPRPHTIRVYLDEARRWRWTRRAGNHRTVAASSQGFRRRWYATRDAKRNARGYDYTIEVLDD